LTLYRSEQVVKKAARGNHFATDRQKNLRKEKIRGGGKGHRLLIHPEESAGICRLKGETIKVA